MAEEVAGESVFRLMGSELNCCSVCFLVESEGLQCYNCRGITDYDPNECFVPVQGKTVQQECQKGEVCEVSQILLFDIIFKP